MIPFDCWNGDHFWNGSGVCSACGWRLRCMCGRFVTERTLEAHEAICPSLLVLDREAE